jgi:hypothetical protein
VIRRLLAVLITLIGTAGAGSIQVALPPPAVST